MANIDKLHVLLISITIINNQCDIEQLGLGAWKIPYTWAHFYIAIKPCISCIVNYAFLNFIRYRLHIEKHELLSIYMFV
jgi:hypothetical protein